MDAAVREKFKSEDNATSSAERSGSSPPQGDYTQQRQIVKPGLGQYAKQHAGVRPAVSSVPAQALELAQAGEFIDLPYITELEAHFGGSLAQLRVSVSSEACALVGAEAFAIANFIVLSSVDVSRDLIGEEVSYAIQQGGHQGVKPPSAGIESTDAGSAAETEARQSGEVFASGLDSTSITFRSTSPISDRRVTSSSDTQPHITSLSYQY